MRLAFDRDSTDFSQGVEVGALWARLSDNPDEQIEQTAHAANAEMFLRMGEALDRAVHSEEIDDTWIDVTFEASGADRP